MLHMMERHLAFCIFLLFLGTANACSCSNSTEPSPSKSAHLDTTTAPSPSNSSMCSMCAGVEQCDIGWYGDDCSKSCSYCPDRCCRKTGHCLSCPIGTFGDNCTQSCSMNCKPANGSVRCEARNGRCEDGCLDGYYDETCTSPCGHCKDLTCSRSTGQCESGCVDGYHGKKCMLTCGFCSQGNCSRMTGLCDSGCKDGFYGASCELLCKNCPCGTCSQITGKCHTNCPEQRTKSSTSTSTSNPTSTTRSPLCPATCADCNGDVCKSCYSGWFGEDCSKSCLQCPGSCSMKTGHCLSCPDGTFGHNCTEECPGKCKPEIDGIARCNAQEGACSNECVDGYYGNTCTLPCGHCADKTCSFTDGQCESGCESGYHGDTCKVPCGFCINKDCSQTTGVCGSGCEAGYYGVTCDLVCKNCTCGICAQNTGQCYTGCLSNKGTDSYEPIEDVLTEGAEDMVAEGTPSTSTYYTGSGPIALQLSQGKGTSKVTVDTAVGVTFALLLIVLCVFAVICVKYRRILSCNIRNRRENNESSEQSKRDVVLYVEDEFGSPKLERNTEPAEEKKLLPTAPPAEEGVQCDDP